MKPFRGKRMGPQSLPGNSIHRAASPVGVRILWTGPAGVGGRWTHFPREERRDRFPGRHEPRRRVARALLGPSGLASGGGPAVGPRIPAGAGEAGPAVGRSTWEDCLQCSLTASVFSARLSRPLRVCGESVGTPSDPS